MDKFPNRKAAGKILASLLAQYKDRNDVIVLGLPRGGVPVAHEIAIALHAPLDVFIVRKLGVPFQPELALGALADGGVTVFNQSIIHQLGISKTDIDSIIASENEELKRREVAYRGNRTFPDLSNKVVILVDDGIATGATIRVAIKAIRTFKPAKLVVAVPVAEAEMCQSIATLVDELICPLRPNDFFAVGLWYEVFAQTEDQEVHDLLQDAAK